MFLEHREKEENKRQATAGYDLTDAYAQISYCLPGEPCPKTISLQADQEQYLIPALLGRYTDQDLWVYGPKAQAAAATGEVFLADGLLTKAAHQEMVEVGGQNYSSIALLSLFLNGRCRCLHRSCARNACRRSSFLYRRCLYPYCQQ